MPGELVEILNVSIPNLFLTNLLKKLNVFIPILPVELKAKALHVYKLAAENNPLLSFFFLCQMVLGNY